MLYFCPVLIAVLMTRMGLVNLKSLVSIGERLADPFSKKIHEWSRQYKLAAMEKGNGPCSLLLRFLEFGGYLLATIIGVRAGLLAWFPGVRICRNWMRLSLPKAREKLSMH